MKMFKRTIVPITIFVIFLLIVSACTCRHYWSVDGSSNPIGSEYTVYGTMRCPYTVKMVDELKAKGKTFTYVDVSTPEGNAAYDEGIQQ